MTLAEKIHAVYAEYYSDLAEIRTEGYSARSELELKLWEETEDKLAAVWISHRGILH